MFKNKVKYKILRDVSLMFFFVFKVWGGGWFCVFVGGIWGGFIFIRVGWEFWE